MVEGAHTHAEELERIGRCDFWSNVKVELILGLVEGRDVLDVGCGACLLSKMLLEKSYNVTAIDIDGKALEIAKKKGIMGFTADINSWETNEKFDCVIAADVLEHIDDDRCAIRRIYNLLKPNGCLILNVPSYKFLFGKHDFSLGHKRRYSDSELKTKLEESGFKVEYQRHWNLLALPTTIVLTEILKKDYPHERISKLGPLSRTLEKLLLLESKVNHLFGISILCKARKQFDPNELDLA
jgi:2-polyprenyl-3-methyl-5-hydroxy-6-metoxy-1,4-benzoquinol methylase